jgi:hypothetical protein
MSKNQEVTKQVSFGNPDDELLPITKCACGQEWESWDFSIGIYEDEPKQCPACGRSFYFRNNIKVFEVDK